MGSMRPPCIRARQRHHGHLSMNLEYEAGYWEQRMFTSRTILG
jgi:hypothetical protein